MPDEHDILEDLLRSAQGEKPEPPVDTAAQRLPLGDIAWEDFERLCVRLARLEADIALARPFGSRGHAQSGIDVSARLTRSNDYAVYQCRRVASLGPADLRRAVDDFLAGDWAGRASRFVFCTSYRAVSPGLTQEIETQHKRLRDEHGITFEVWDAEELTQKLKLHPELVREFFGDGWWERFAPAAADEAVDERLRGVEGELRGLRQEVRERVRIITLDWAPEALRKALERLQESQPEQLARFYEHFGDPPKVRLVPAAVAEPPGWLEQADADVWQAVARLGESGGEWSAASQAWEQVAEREAGGIRADRLVAAAVAAHVGGDDERHDELLEKARGVNATHPRVLLQDVDDYAPADEQLRVLEVLRSDDPSLQTLILARTALASLLLPDVEKARAHLPLASSGRRTSLTTVALLPFAGAIAGVYLAADTDRIPLVVLGVLCAVGSAVAAPTLWRQRPWLKLVRDRLWSYERPLAGPVVPVLVQEHDLDHALAAVRRAKLNPSGILRLGSPPPDVPFLRTKINVMEPADWAASPSDEALVRRVAEVFRAARITARVAGN